MKKAVILINIGSPDEMTVSATRRYLRNFLMDRRVIDIPFISRFLLVNGIIAPFRAPKSLNSYKKILIENESPLLFYSYELEKKLQNALGERYMVRIAMMYGKPYLKDVLNELKQQPLEEIILLPLYPQYASSTTGSALEMAFNEIKQWQIIPNIKTIHTFYNHPEFTRLWVNQIKQHLPEQYDYVLFSYHGLPVRQIFKADKQLQEKFCNLMDCCDENKEGGYFCYRKNCLITTKKIAEQLQLPLEKYGFSFQSRLGRSEWLKPYSSDTIIELAQKGIKHLVVVSPAFVIDCLETLFEIQIEYKELFKQYGGEHLTLIPSLNAEEGWVIFLRNLITK
ncbi:MAG: ferrochelatase [Bacteroidia bacterium]|nr:MAG: ferrochelatase [Bacteroidia bacterium]